MHLRQLFMELYWDKFLLSHSDIYHWDFPVFINMTDITMFSLANQAILHDISPCRSRERIVSFDIYLLLQRPKAFLPPLPSLLHNATEAANFLNRTDSWKPNNKNQKEINYCIHLPRQLASAYCHLYGYMGVDIWKHNSYSIVHMKHLKLVLLIEGEYAQIASKGGYYFFPKHSEDQEEASG